MFRVAEDSRNVHGAGQRDEDLLALGVRPEAGNAVAGFLKLGLSVLEALERLLVELQILVHLVLELGQLHETQLGQIKHLRLAGLVRHFDFGDEKLVKDMKRKKNG